ncbi:MAG TPA: glycosyltransferase family 39 protein [Pyrinomonadaceae bacterium]|nr:glycosyltransferase family 39 protein [Pyrinomonadaceae bacterium]
MESPERTKPDGMFVVLALSLALLIFHCIFNNRYGYFRDEFNYMSSGDHLAWGYVDQPPLLPFLVRVSRAILGDSLRSIRFLPALAMSAAVVLTALIAREFGGRRFALVLSAVAMIIAPMYLSNGSLVTTNCLEPLLWMGCAYFAILAVKKDERYWLGFGAVAGLGLEEKYSIAIFGFAVVVGLLLTKERRAIVSKWFWLGGALAFLIFLPNVIWSIQNNWPFLELMRNIRAVGRDVELSPLEFFVQQIVLLHPLTAPIWITGLVALLFSRRLRQFRFLGWAYVISFVTFVLLKGKNYYLAPIYPMLLAAGALMIEALICRNYSTSERERSDRFQGTGSALSVESGRSAPVLRLSGFDKSGQRLWLKVGIIVVLLAGGALLAPFVVPVFSVDRFISYMNSSPLKPPRTEHSHERAQLPQHYADQFGWQELTAKTAEAWLRLAPEERPDCGIYAQNYGQAGAIDFFGPRYGLPRAVSGHQSYYLWGPRGYSGNCMIVIDDDKETLERLFEHVEFVGTSDNPYALERNLTVWLCKGSKFGTLTQLWPRVKKWR